MERKNITKRIGLLFFPLFLIILGMLFSIIFSFVTLKKTFIKYTDEYYKLSTLSEAISGFMVKLDNYVLEDTDTNRNAIGSYYSADLKPAVGTVYAIRFELSNGNRSEIEVLNDIVNFDLKNDIELLETNKDEGIRTIIHDIHLISEKVNSAVEEELAEGNRKYDTKRTAVFVIEGIMILLFLCFIGITAYVIFYMEKRIASPLRDITEWSKLFKDNYVDMSELRYEGNDEIGDLVESFNIVKERLVEANKLKKDNEITMRKLKEEEEYKKKFVKQLYDEKREKESISSEAKRDGLTGLYNRRSFDALIDEFVGNKPVAMEGALFLIDMDNFKNVNDTLGHLAGDEALKTLAGAMRVVFPGGYLGRYGGDEFIAFLTGVSSDEELGKLGRALCDKMDRFFEADGKSVKLSVSIGISNTVGLEDYAELYMKADKALYFSKEHGRNQYTIANKVIMNL